MTWQFKLPEITYPLEINSVGMIMVTGHDITMQCHVCGRHARVNLVPIAKRHGMAYSTLTPSLRKVVSCKECKAAGRRKDIGFLLSAGHVSAWPRGTW